MKNYSRVSFLVCSISLIAGAFFYYPKWQQPHTEATISWDVSGYYLYLPAVFIYKDLKHLSFGDSILQKYRPAPELGAFEHPGGGRVIKYSSGQALQFLPWFLAGHFGAILFGYPPDGFSFPYQFAISMGSLLIAMLGLWFLRKILVRYFSDPVVAITLLLITLGTNYLEYAAFHGALTHNWLFTLYTLLIFSTIRFYEKPTYRWAACIGVLVGWAALTRPTDIIAAVIPLFWGLSTISSFQDRYKIWRMHNSKLILAASLTILMGFIQLVYWKYVAGEWIVYSYQEQGFSWLHPHLMDGLFSYRAGWLVYTPLMAFALTGFVFLYKRQPNTFPTALLFCCMYLYVTFAWDIWWYGGSLGQRAMIQAYPMLAFPLAAFVTWVLKQKPVLRFLFAGFAGAIVWYNLWLTHHAHKGGLLVAGDMTRAYYWKIFGKNAVEEEACKLLDTDEEFSGIRKNVIVLYSNAFENDTTSCPYPPIAGNRSLCLNEARQYSPVFKIPLPDGNATWIRTKATFKCLQKEWDVWKMAQLIVVFYNGDTRIKEKQIRVHRLLYDGETQVVFLDTKIPQEAYNRIEVLFWNGNGTKPLVIDDFSVESFEEKY